MRVKQSEVPESFKMLVPVKVTLDNNRVTRVRLMMTGKELTVELPLYDSEPDDLLFNDLRSVLCTVKTESF
ncbi:MAG: hypothetical protein HQ472_09145 [Ignavibacteria bacterium]|nr:hypothetical protein [Ignavibacteria bacterium]